MYHVLPSAVTGKLKYDCDGLSYFQKTLRSFFFFSLKSL